MVFKEKLIRITILMKNKKNPFESDRVFIVRRNFQAMNRGPINQQQQRCFSQPRMQFLKKNNPFTRKDCYYRLESTSKGLTSHISSSNNHYYEHKRVVLGEMNANRTLTDKEKWKKQTEIEERQKLRIYGIQALKYISYSSFTERQGRSSSPIQRENGEKDKNRQLFQDERNTNCNLIPKNTIIGQQNQFQTKKQRISDSPSIKQFKSLRLGSSNGFATNDYQMQDRFVKTQPEQSFQFTSILRSPSKLGLKRADSYGSNAGSNPNSNPMNKIKFVEEVTEQSQSQDSIKKSRYSKTSFLSEQDAYMSIRSHFGKSKERFANGPLAFKSSFQSMKANSIKANQSKANSIKVNQSKASQYGLMDYNASHLYIRGKSFFQIPI